MFSAISGIKRYYPILTLVFFSLSLVGGVFLVKRTQNLQKGASGCPWYAPRHQCPSDWFWNQGDCTTAEDGSQNCCCTQGGPVPTTPPGQQGQLICRRDSNTSITLINNTGRDIAYEIQEFRGCNCQADQCLSGRVKYVQPTVRNGETKTETMQSAFCEAIQLDIKSLVGGYPCIDPNTGRQWDGGVAFAIDRHCGPGCEPSPPPPSTTPSPVPSQPPTPTPTTSPPSFSCNGLTQNGQSGNLTITLGQSVDLDASVSHFGIISSAKVNNIGDRVVNGTDIRRLAQGDHPTAVFQPNQSGIYVFEVNAYDNSQCNYLCSAGSILYKNRVGPNRCVTDANDWDNLGQSCPSNGCIRWLTVTQPDITLTPTPSPRISVTPTSTPRITVTPTSTPRITTTPTSTPRISSTPTNTPVPGELTCDFVRIYDSQWNQINDLDLIRRDQVVYLATRGITGGGVNVTKARFRISINGQSGNWLETNQKRQDEFYLSYTIPRGGVYEVEAMVYNPSLGWR